MKLIMQGSEEGRKERRGGTGGVVGGGVVAEARLLSITLV